MSIQVRTNNDNEPFVLDDTAEVITDLTLAADQALITKGTLLGEVGSTADGGTIGQVVVITSSAVDGSQIPKYLLADETVAINTAATQTIAGYVGGLFDENQLVFPTTSMDLTTQATLSTDDGVYSSMKDLLRDANIRVAPGISVSGPENPVI